MVAPTEILLIEDNPADARLAQEALRAAGVVATLRHLRRGDEALAYLRRQSPHQQATRPALVLLDLNLPGRSGHELLAEIKADPELRSIPVIVLSSSPAPEDVARSYDLHANAYLVKETDLDRFLETMRSLAAFWLGSVRLPAESPPGAGGRPA